MEHEAVVRIFCAERAGIHTGFLKNLSPGGMFLHIVDPEPPGTRLHFELRLDPRRSEVVTGSGEVAFCREVYGGPGRPPGMGIRFLALTREGAVALSERLGEPPEAAISEESRPPPPPRTDSEAAVESPEATEEADSRQLAVSESPLTDPLSEAATEWWVDPEPRRSTTAGFALWVAGVVAVLLAGAVWFQRAGEPEPRGAVAEAAVPDVSAGRPEDPPPARSSAPPAPREVATPTALDPGESSPLPPLSRVQGIRWEEGPESIVVVVAGNGLFEDGRASFSHIGGDAPRGVVRIRNVERAGDRFREELPSDLVASIRTGYHQVDGDRGDLHLVLDFRDPTARITGVLPAGSELLVYVGRM